MRGPPPRSRRRPVPLPGRGEGSRPHRAAGTTAPTKARSPPVAIDGLRGRQDGRRAPPAVRTRRRLAFVGGPSEIHQVAERPRWSPRCCGRVADATVELIETTERNARQGRELGHRIADRPESERPDGIFAVNDLVAVGLLQALVVERGLPVPDASRSSGTTTPSPTNTHPSSSPRSTRRRRNSGRRPWSLLLAAEASPAPRLARSCSCPN